jgi:putative transposase
MIGASFEIRLEVSISIATGQMVGISIVGVRIKSGVSQTAVEAGRTVRDVCREHEISDATYYKWKTKYGGMEAADIRRLRELEEENRRLKQMYAELSLEHRMLKDVLTKKL